MKYNFPALSTLHYCDTLEYIEYDSIKDKMIFEFSNVQGKKYKLSIPPEGYKQNGDYLYLEFKISGSVINIEAVKEKNWYSNIDLFKGAKPEFVKAFNKSFKNIFH